MLQYIYREYQSLKALVFQPRAVSSGPLCYNRPLSEVHVANHKLHTVLSLFWTLSRSLHSRC
jgi:hypothetical protein